MLLPLLVASAIAATPEDIAHGWYLAESGRLKQAAQLAAVALSENPHDLQAHRLYILSLVEGLQDGAALEQQYRGWREAEPDNDYARVALAGLLVDLHEEEGPWCDEVEALLNPLPKDTGVLFWAHRYRYTARGVCPADPAEDHQALLDLAKVTPSALGFSLRLRMAEGRIDEALASDLQTFYTLEPWNLAFPGNLWGDEVKGPALKAARASALDAARGALEADGPAYAQGAFRIFAQAGNDAGRVAAETRRAELDPEWSTSDRAWNGERLSLTQDGRSSLERALERARLKASIEAAREALAALEPAIPPHGPLRSIYRREQAYIQYRAGDEDAAFASFEAAWQEDPSNASAANGFAYLAALRGEKLDLALVVMDSILQQSPPYDPWLAQEGISYDAWAARQSDQVAARLDTRAWILHQLDRTEEAASVMQRALLLIGEPDPILYHHLGLILLELGQPDAALEALGRGLALGPSAEQALDTLARETALELFSKHRWAHGGLDEWVGTRLPPRQAPARRDGELMPDMAFTVDDKPRQLSDFEGIKVVVLWSARGTPFLESLPYWEALVKRYRKDPVQFLGLCIDERAQNTTEFWQGYRLPPLLLGWVGPEGAELAGIDSAPTALLVDGHGMIRGQLVGQVSPDDMRLADWIDGVLAETWEAEEAGD
jgi:tetratricopeptide (TPR) repeat protein